MKTTSVYHGFAMQYEELSKEIVKRITAAAVVEKLYLLGLTTAYQRTETLFSVQSATRREVTHYYLLVLIEKNDEHSLNSVQDKIEGSLQLFLPVTAIVFSYVHFFRWLSEGHPFAAAVYEKAFPLYQKDEVPLPFPATANEEVFRKEAEQLYAQSSIRVQEFLAGAELYRIRVQYKMAAFMLHQAAEQALITILKIITGLHLNTHSIDRLIRCCTLASDKFSAIFPRNNDREERLFQLIQKAYIGARYKEDYNINGEHLLKLTERVKALEKLMKEVCSNGLKLAGEFD